jgi:hypothetical protein
VGKDFFSHPTFFETDTPNCFNIPQEDAILANGTIAFTNYILGITPVCFFNSSDADNACKNMALLACFIWHMLTDHFYTCSSFMYSFFYPSDFMNDGLGPFLVVVSIIAIAIYFITSSNSGSLIVDHLASNGNEEHHWLQQLFWALPEGAVASALLVSGRAQSLQALQAVSIVAGLPFMVLLVYMMSSIYTMCDLAENGIELIKEEVKKFAMCK